MTRANLVPPTRDHLGANPSATGESKALSKAPAVNPDHERVHTHPEGGVSDGLVAFAVSPPLMRDTIARHWSVSSRRPHPVDRDPPGSDGAPRFPAPHGVGLRTEVQRRLPVGARESRDSGPSRRDATPVSRHRSDDFQTTHPSASAFRREGAPAAGGFRLGARRPRDIHHPHW